MDRKLFWIIKTESEADHFYIYDNNNVLEVIPIPTTRWKNKLLLFFFFPMLVKYSSQQLLL